MLYGNETWCLRESEMATLRRTKIAMVRSMCGVTLVDRNSLILNLFSDNIPNFKKVII